MSRKYIYQLPEYTDSTDQYAAIDKSGSSSAERILWPHHIVSSLPGSPVLGFLYSLTTATGNYPEGLYQHDGTGWICVTQYEEIELTAWTGAVSIELISGVAYQVSVSGAVTSLGLTMSTDGVCRLLIDNPSTFAIAEPTSGYKMTSTGLDALSAASVRMTLQRDTVSATPQYEYGTSERVAL